MKPKKKQSLTDSIQAILQKRHSRSVQLRVSAVLALIIAVLTVVNLVLPAVTLSRDSGSELAERIEFSFDDAGEEPPAEEPGEEDVPGAEGEPDGEDGQSEDAVYSVEDDTEATELDCPAQMLVAQSDSFFIYAEAGEGALPADSQLIVSEVAPEDVLDAVESVVKGEILDLRAVSVVFCDADGTEIDPILPVRLYMHSPFLEDAGNPAAVRVDAEGQAAAVEEAVPEEYTPAEDEIVIWADATAVYAVADTDPFVTEDEPAEEAEEPAEEGEEPAEEGEEPAEEGEEPAEEGEEPAEEGEEPAEEGEEPAEEGEEPAEEGEEPAEEGEEPAEEGEEPAEEGEEPAEEGEEPAEEGEEPAEEGEEPAEEGEEPAEEGEEPAEEEETAEEGESEEAEEEIEYPAQQFTDETGGVRVNVDAPEGAFPAGTTMTARIIPADGIVDKVTEAVEGKIVGLQAVDIVFFDPDGQEIEPLVPVRVSLSAAGIAEADTSVVHVDNTGEAVVVEQTAPEELDVAPAEDEVVFEAGGFSVYILVYTVDFHWEVDGQTYDYSITGGSGIALSELLPVLGVLTDDPETDLDEVWAFIADIQNVEISDPGLLWIGKTEEETCVGALKEENGLECEYSAELTEEEIEEINALPVAAGDWVLISMRAFDTEETLTVTMNDGDVFEIRVTDVAYQGTKVTDLNGKTVALLNLTNNNALQSTAHSVSGRLQATDIQLDGNRVTSLDPLSTWTFSRVPNTTNQYYIQASNGYLNMDNGGKLSVSINPQAFFIKTRSSDGAIKIDLTNTNTSYSVNNYENRTADGYSGYSSNWDANPGEWFTPYEIGDPIIPHVTVHYVDRNGNPLTGVEYGGNNPLVVQNDDGTFTIPYDWSGGQTSDTSIDLRTDFSKMDWTYANTHLAGKDAKGNDLTHNGYIIDSVLTRSGTDLQFKSDSGATSAGTNNNPPLGNLQYGDLTSFSLSGNVNARPAVDGTRITYATAGNKDIYVILDPPPQNNPSGNLPTGNAQKPDAPTLTKEMEDNKDGTYTLSLTVDAHANSASDTNKANILFVVDTSSSMRAKTSSDSRNRIMDTHDAVLDLGQKFLKYNELNELKPDAVQVAMITFDGGVNERLGWTTDTGAFTSAVNNWLKYYYLHTGTDWEDAMKEALSRVQSPPDSDPTFVIFFTDGEPSQYTSFHGAGENTHTDDPDPITGGTAHEAVTGGYPDFFNYFLCREASKDEMRAIVDSGVTLFGIYAYNTTEEYYEGYNGDENGALMLHNAIKYGYNTDDDLEDKFFFEANDTNALENAFHAIFKTITESVGFSNVVVTDGISTDVTSTTVVNGDVSAFTYEIRNKSGVVEYKVTVTPDNTPMFTIGSGTPVAGEKKQVTTTKIKTDDEGNPIQDEDGKIQTEEVPVEVYYYKDPETNIEYIMPIATPGTTVEWDLSPLGMLKDGYSYEVSFVVWPNQASYDLVADLNNGIKPAGITENWDDDDLEWHSDVNERRYKIGGISGHEYIALYEDGTYAALSNTEQKVQYCTVDKTIIDGEEVTVYSDPNEVSVDPPDPMRLEATASQIEKVWNIDRDPDILARLLYGTPDNPESHNPYSISLDLLQDGTGKYLSIALGWDNEQQEYIWKSTDMIYVKWDSEKSKYVTCSSEDEGAKEIGTHWVEDFSIATGLMLSQERMSALGLNTEAYVSALYPADGGTRYYLLEEGHDYTISEPNVGYEFDFEAPVYHPMLVNGDLKNVNLENIVKNEEGKLISFDITGINSIDVAANGRSALMIENTLRGYIHVKKIVVGEDGESHLSPVETDETKFTYTIELNYTSEDSSEPGPFTGTHIPWYGVNDLFYNTYDEETRSYTYYQARVTGSSNQVSHTLYLITESGDRYEAWATYSDGTGIENESITFDEDSPGPTWITYKIPGETEEEAEYITIELRGNQMDCTDSRKVSVEFQITQKETLSIANVPVGTQFTVKEYEQSGYQFVGIDTNVPGSTKNGMQIEGMIVPNSDNNITYTNKIVSNELSIQKVDSNNVGLSGAVFQLKKVDAVTGESPVTDETVMVDNAALGSIKIGETTYDGVFTTNGKKQTLSGLPNGKYRLYEVSVPPGYICTFRYIEFKVNNRQIEYVKTDTGENLSFIAASGNTLALLEIVNKAGASLPSTGGSGTALYPVAGGLAVALSGGMLLLRRRKRED